MQRFIEGVRNLELKRNLALVYAQEQYVETPPTAEALRISMRVPARSENFPAPQQQLQNPVLVNPQNPTSAAAAPVPNAQQPPQQPVANRQQSARACFNCGDPSHFVADCPLKDRAQKPLQQLVNSCRTNIAGERTCPSNPRGINNDILPAALPERGTAAFCVTCGRTGHVASNCMAPEIVATVDQMRAAWYAHAPQSVESTYRFR